LSDDVYEPLDRYCTEFREKFARLTREMFASLVKASGVDEAKNAETIATIDRLVEEHRTVQSQRWRWGVLIAIAVLAIIFLVLGAASAILGGFEKGSLLAVLLGLLLGAVGVAVPGLLLGNVFVPNYRRLTATAGTLSGQIEKLKNKAWVQMAPLNQLYDWDMATRLIAQTVPKIQFDPFFTAARLQELEQNFGLVNYFDKRQSVLSVQSGAINGNPFVIAQVRKMHWSERTYTGSKEISWTERVKDKDGKYVSVQRRETLVARVRKPIPVYSEERFLLYGNDAVPGLTFSRSPSSLSGGDGILHSLHKKIVIGGLKDFSRNLEDESQFTLMANHDFEAFFHATDRNNEIDFRLLFTPLAQQQMLKLLKDKKIGFGDDFAFVKQGKLNAIYPQHLNRIQLNIDPRNFAHYRLDSAKELFQRTHEEYFRAIYFALAPLLAIPLYQQTKPQYAINDSSGHRLASSWELESLANYHGERYFRHPQCITSNILKTQRRRQAGGASVIAVTASGYAGKTRTESQNIRGGDGRIHSVSVKWTEYLPVHQTKTMLVAEQPELSQQDCRRRLSAIPEEWQRLLRNREIDWEHGIYRRSILSFLG
jgi:hypothetical protein